MIVTNTELLCLESQGVKRSVRGTRAECWWSAVSGWLRLAPVLHSQSKLQHSLWFITPFQYAANSNPSVHSTHVQLTPITQSGVQHSSDFLLRFESVLEYGAETVLQISYFTTSWAPIVLSATLWARHDGLCSFLGHETWAGERNTFRQNYFNTLEKFVERKCVTLKSIQFYDWTLRLIYGKSN